jgi:hypothetical protein
MDKKPGPSHRSKPAKSPYREGKRSFLFKITTVLLTTLIMMLFMELTLQVVARLRDGKWLFQDPVSSKVVYVKLIKEKRKFTLKPGFKIPGGGLEIDNLGFRKGPFPIDEKNKIIVNAGDSIPFGDSVRNDQTYPYHLARLVKRKGIPINVLNSGIPSYNMWQSFERLRNEVFRHYQLSRIAVLTMQVANDVFLLSYYRQKWFPDITWADRRFIEKKPFINKIATFHYAKQIIKKLTDEQEEKSRIQKRISRLRKNRDMKYYNYEGTRKKYDYYEGSDMLQMVRETLYNELDFYKQHNIPVVLMPIDPFYYQISNLDKNPTLKKWKQLQYIVKAARDLIYQFNDLLIEISQEFDHVYFLDTRPILDQHNRDKTHIDHIHYSGTGARIVAKHLLDFLIEHQLIPPGKTDSVDLPDSDQ